MLNLPLSSSMRVVAGLEGGQSERAISKRMKELEDEQSLQTRANLLGCDRNAITSTLAAVLLNDLTVSQYEQFVPMFPIANENG